MHTPVSMVALLEHAMVGCKDESGAAVTVEVCNKMVYLLHDVVYDTYVAHVRLGQDVSMVWRGKGPADL